MSDPNDDGDFFNKVLDVIGKGVVYAKPNRNPRKRKKRRTDKRKPAPKNDYS